MCFNAGVLERMRAISSNIFFAGKLSQMRLTSAQWVWVHIYVNRVFHRDLFPKQSIRRNQLVGKRTTRKNLLKAPRKGPFTKDVRIEGGRSSTKSGQGNGGRERWPNEDAHFSRLRIRDFIKNYVKNIPGNCKMSKSFKNSRQIVMQNIKILVVAQLLSKRTYLLKYISGTKQQM